MTSRHDDSAPARVLVVDDEPDIVDLVRANLEAAGYTVETAPDGAAALDALREDPADLVLLDVMMPRVDGWTVLRELQDDKRLADVPVVLLTALDGEQHRLRGTLTGAVRYVTKPFHLDPLLDVVAAALQPLDEERRAARRAELAEALQRLALLHAARPDGSTATTRGSGPAVRLTKLERAPQAAPALDASRLGAFTDHQRAVGGMLADGEPPRRIASTLGVSRAAVYATRARIAHHLGVGPEEVANACRCLGLTVS